VEVSVEQLEEGSVLRVENTGPGIPAVEHARVFERFYRGAGVQAEGTEGCGLGLSIAWWIAAAHGALLGFESVQDRTVFNVRMDDMKS
jgi:two-component system sensor histidine kinase QseC